jgi:hypothetical protein
VGVQASPQRGGWRRCGAGMREDREPAPPPGALTPPRMIAIASDGAEIVYGVPQHSGRGVRDVPIRPSGARTMTRRSVQSQPIITS